MGLYDRDYVRDDEPQRDYGAAPQRSIATTLIIINVAVFLIDMFSDQALRRATQLPSDAWGNPLEWWKLATYGFLHGDPLHLLFNMLGLFWFGPPVEQQLGRQAFLRCYGVALLVSGAAWLASHAISGRPAVLLGASGGVLAMGVLFGFFYPRAQIFLFGVIPMQARFAVALFVGLDLFGFFGGGGREGRVAYEAHLAGAAYALAYAWLFRGRWGEAWTRWWIRWRARSRGMNVFSPPEPSAAEWDARVDAILEKISREGEGSLTQAERRTLTAASRRYQQRRS